MVFIGLINMLEFVYFGLGFNLYYGMLINVIYFGCVLGGFMSGGVVVVVFGLCDIVIGSDIGGFLCILVVFNGIIGFKFI